MAGKTFIMFWISFFVSESRLESKSWQSKSRQTNSVSYLGKTAPKVSRTNGNGNSSNVKDTTIDSYFTRDKGPSSKFNRQSQEESGQNVTGVNRPHSSNNSALHNGPSKHTTPDKGGG